MRIIDTVVLLAFLDLQDPRNRKANEYILDINLKQDVFVPSATLFELDLELKTHGVSAESRSGIHSRFRRVIPRANVLTLVPAVLERAATLSKEAATWRDSYFDTIIAASGLEYGAETVITTDRKFEKLGLQVIF